MNKKKISEYCKELRNKTGLTIEQYALNLRCSRQYVGKIESGALDEKHSVAQINRLYRVYRLTFDDLHAMEIQEIFVEGVGYLNLTDPYFSAKSGRHNETILKSYLKSCGYLDLQTRGKFDMTGLNEKKQRFYCEILLPFSTSISQNKRKELITKKIKGFIENVFQIETFDDNNKIELIIFTSSERTYKQLQQYKEERFRNVTAGFIGIKVIYLFQNRKPEEFIML